MQDSHVNMWISHVNMQLYYIEWWYTTHYIQEKLSHVQLNYDHVTFLLKHERQFC